MSRPAPRVIVYVAMSVDGYIATADGGVGWLESYDPANYGHAEFEAGIGTIVMGRATYDQVLTFGDWPYGGKRVVVLTSHELHDPAPGVEARAGALAALAAELRASDGGDIWVEGGSRTVAAFLDAGAVDLIQLFVIPVLLGDGIPLFARGGAASGLQLSAMQRYPDGVVRLDYEVSGGCSLR